MERQNAILRAALENIMDTFTQEINPVNYNHDDVCRMNQEMIQALTIAAEALENTA